MTRRTSLLQPGLQDGTSQRGRALAALDPATAPLDERGSADLLAAVQTWARRLRYISADESSGELVDGGNWQDFAEAPGISVADMVAYLADPGSADPAKADWLARPHFALLLVFVQLLARARDQLNGLTARHLDFYYRDLLRLAPEPAEPDRAAVVLKLAPRVAELRLPAGTALEAGRDSAGVTQVYLTERELVVTQAQVAALRSVFIDRLVIGISDVRADRSLTAAEAFDATLRLALGAPTPGDPVPRWRNNVVDGAFVKGLRPALALCRADAGLYLEHFELRALMRLVRRRDAGTEWSRINTLLGSPAPPKPRDFAGNLARAILPQVIDPANDGLPQVNNIDDLYRHADEPEVRAYLDQKLARIGNGNGTAAFLALMPLKLRVDADWAEINRLLERAGQRLRGQPAWPLAPADATDFAANLLKALNAKPPAWPFGGKSIYDFDTALRELEVHFATSIERLDRLAGFSDRMVGDKAEAFDWTDTDRTLSDAHRERVFAARRVELAAVRGSDNSVAGFDREVQHVVDALALPPAQQPADWDAALALLAGRGRLDAIQQQTLSTFRLQLADPAAQRTLDWPDVEAVLELAWRTLAGLPDPVAQRIEWRNLYPNADARTCTDDPASPRWKTFGQRPPGDPALPPPPCLGWALSSPLLRMSEGQRTVTMTLGFAPESFDRGLLLRGLGLVEPMAANALKDALAAAWVIELSGVKAWVQPTLLAVALASGVQGDDYASLSGLPATDIRRPALQLRLALGADAAAVAPPPGAAEPQLRLRLRPRWDSRLAQWTTQAQPFEPLQLAALRLQVAVQGLAQLQLQQDERVLDARKPFQPFGNRPLAGARFYFGHPELLRERLDSMSLRIEWMGLPLPLATYYARYAATPAAVTTFVAGFTADVAMVDRSLELPLLAGTALFGSTAATDIAIDLPARLKATSPGFAYTRRSDLAPASDLRAAGRLFRIELNSDLGHAGYPALAALWAARLAAALMPTSPPAAAAPDVTAYQINPPYAPQVKKLSAGWTASVEVRPADGAVAQAGADVLLHLHPFGVSAITPAEPTLLPRYEQAGELCIALRNVAAPQHITLLLQLAEGTSDPDIDPAPVSWSCLDGDQWQRIDVIADDTRGLLNSGIVELALPSPTAVAPSSRMGDDAGLTWLRVAAARNTAAVCDGIDILAQAVSVRFDDRGNAPEHYAQPLPVGRINRLEQPDARIAAVQQPFTSYGGRPAEAAEHFHTRISERLRHKQRALSPWDFERLVLQRFGQIYKAKCLPAGAGMGDVAGEVTVIVIPDIRNALPGDALAPKAPSNLLADIQAFLAARAPAAAHVRVRNAQYVPVRVRLGVRFMPGQDESFARRRLNDDLVRFLSPWAYDEGAELMIGGRVYANSIIDFVDRRDYVDHVVEVKLFRGRGHDDFDFIPPADDYHVATEQPDEVLVAARQHDIDVIPELGYEQANFTGIDYMKLELDFIVHA
jgi:hypothetical protein